MASPNEGTTSQTITGAVFALAMLFCGMEMVPGWGFLHLDWPHWIYYLIMAITGAIAGSCCATEHPLPGLVGGLVAGPGAIFAIAFLLAHSTETYDFIIFVVGVIGILPGLIIYKVLAKLEDTITGPPRSSAPLDSQSAAPESQNLFDPTNPRQ